MTRRELRLSPQAFERLQVELNAARSRGFDETAATRMACSRIGYWPEDGTETILIVDSALVSVCYPFEELCSEDVK